MSVIPEQRRTHAGMTCRFAWSPVNLHLPSRLGFEANDRFCLCWQGLFADKLSQGSKPSTIAQLHDFPGNNGRRDFVGMRIAEPLRDVITVFIEQ